MLLVYIDVDFYSVLSYLLVLAYNLRELIVVVVYPSTPGKSNVHVSMQMKSGERPEPSCRYT